MNSRGNRPQEVRAAKCLRNVAARVADEIAEGEHRRRLASRSEEVIRRTVVSHVLLQKTAHQWWIHINDFCSGLLETDDCVGCGSRRRLRDELRLGGLTLLRCVSEEIRQDVHGMPGCGGDAIMCVPGGRVAISMRPQLWEFEFAAATVLMHT